MKNENEKQGEMSIKSVRFSQIEEKGTGGAPSSIDLLKDVPLTVTAELGRTTKMMVKDILKLGVGSVIELEKEAGDPVDILVNNKLIAKGEVVEVDGNFGVRITDVMNR